MNTATSGDGVAIAYDRIGDGPTVVIVGGAFSVADDGRPLADALAALGFEAVVYDRRARAGSGDRRGSTPDDEASDLAAVIDAVGGDAAVLGHSSGAILALYAAMRGVPITALFLSEPPLRTSGDGPPDDLATRLQQLVDDGHPDEAVVTFQLEAVGLPREMVDQIRASELFPSLVAVAQSTVYDMQLTAMVSALPAAERAVAQPVTVLRGAQTFPFLIEAADRLAAELSGAELVVVPESVMHRPDPAATARVVRDRL